MAPITVLLVDDHELVREGIRHVVEEIPDITIVGEAADGIEAVRQAELKRPAVVLLDITMPSLNGLEATRQIKQRSPSTAVVFLTVHESEEYFLEALRCGVEGYLPKSAPASEVIDAIRSACRGQVYIHPSVARFLVRNLINGGNAGALRDPYQELTPREREVLSLVAGGLTTNEMAERLFLSPNTVHRHRTSLMQKLGLHDRLDILRYC
ncbi:MAG: response regulator transcription factor, partial [Chloroflexota bacterium]|nr:response regulator transcription factor [Chloroflexota bacterium]